LRAVQALSRNQQQEIEMQLVRTHSTWTCIAFSPLTCHFVCRVTWNEPTWSSSN
jgi:hypothetical protein